MGDTFELNGYIWRILHVDSNDPMLVDRTGRVTVATTDPDTLSIYISNDVTGKFYDRVLIHELGHCVIFSFHLLDDIHQMVHPRYWVEAEEWLCNFIADYGVYILKVFNSIGR